MEDPDPTDTISDSVWFAAVQHMFLQEYKETLPPITRRMVEAYHYGSNRLLNILDMEILQRPRYADKLHPVLQRILAGHRNMIRSQHQQPSPKATTSQKIKSVGQNSPPDVSIELDREPFFQIGRALQRGLGKGKLGCVTLSAKDGVLTIESDWGGSRIPCTKGPAVSATAFCALITTRYREKQPSGVMTIVFRPKLKEIGIDLIGVKAHFDPC